MSDIDFDVIVKETGDRLGRKGLEIGGHGAKKLKGALADAQSGLGG